MVPDQLRTNRDLYLFVAELLRRHAATDRDLEQYLTALWCLAANHSAENAISLGCFANLIDVAFSAAVTAQPPPPGANPRGQDEGFARWEHTIVSQIIDLREMHAKGILSDEYRYFGVDAPGGARWYNFDPLTYLECAMAGTFGGWRQGDDTGRAFVPGKVAVFDSEGRMAVVDPRDIDEPVFEIVEITWDDFTEFLRAGQCYE